MRNYRSISAPDSWTYIYVKNMSEGADADKPNLMDGFGFPAYAQGLGYRSSDQTLWGVTQFYYVTKYDSKTGQELDSWQLYGGCSGAEIDGDNDDWLWVTTRFDAVAKYSLSKRTDQAEVTYFHISNVDGTNYAANGICAPAGEYIYIGIMNAIVRKIRKADGAIIADYPVPFDPSDLAWDGTNIWVSYSDQPQIDCYNPNDFTLVKSINSPYASNQGLTFDGEGLWVSYAYYTDDNGIISKLGEAGGGSPAKIYYATDTETMYWNVGGQWQEVPKGADNFLAFVDSPDSYDGQSGKMVIVNSTEDGLEFISPPEPPPQTSIAKTGAAAMSGDILIEAGDNVTITQDDTAKKIVISAVAVEPPPPEPPAPAPTINGMTGDLTLQAGENVTVTNDNVNKIITIAATALEPAPATGDANSLNGIPVNTSALNDGYVLTYDAVTGKIMLKPKPAEGGGGGHLIGIHTLLNIDSKALTNANSGTNVSVNVASSNILKP